MPHRTCARRSEAAGHRGFAGAPAHRRPHHGGLPRPVQSGGAVMVIDGGDPASWSLTHQGNARGGRLADGPRRQTPAAGADQQRRSRRRHPNCWSGRVTNPARIGPRRRAGLNAGGSGGVGHAADGSARPVGSPPDPVVVIPSWEYSCCWARRLLAVMARSTLMCRCLRHPDSPRRRYRPATAANDSLVPNHPAFTVTRLGRPVSLSRYTCPSAPPGMPRRRECRAAAAAVTDPVENVRDCSIVGVARRGRRRRGGTAGAPPPSAVAQACAWYSSVVR